MDWSEVKERSAWFFSSHLVNIGKLPQSETIPTQRYQASLTTQLSSGLHLLAQVWSRGQLQVAKQNIPSGND